MGCLKTPGKWESKCGEKMGTKCEKRLENVEENEKLLKSKKLIWRRGI